MEIAAMEVQQLSAQIQAASFLSSIQRTSARNFAPKRKTPKEK
jgi:hypothetical protein